MEDIRSKKALGVALGGIQMHFNLPAFLNQRIKASDKGPLFSRWGERDRIDQHIRRPNSCVVCRALRLDLSSESLGSAIVIKIASFDP